MSNSRRKVYTHSELRRMFRPESVAVIGASPNQSGFGARTVANIQDASFDGRLYRINAKYCEISGHRYYSSVGSLPEIPDCAIIAVPRLAVEDAVLDCVRYGVGAIIIYASGYGETRKPDRIQQQERLTRIAEESRIPILGPNCAGIINYKTKFVATFFRGEAKKSSSQQKGTIGLVSQSGALGFALAQARECGIPLSHALTCGNVCDVDIADEINFLAGDPDCTVIACSFEGLRAPSRLIEAAAAAAAASKPIVVFKMGTSEQGAAGAMSHTGSLAGSNIIYEAAFRRSGMVMVDNFEALCETAAFFSKAPPVPSANGIGVIAPSGGACIMASDAAEKYHVSLPQPNKNSHEILSRVIPEFGSPNNPCDVTAQVVVNPESLKACVDALVSDDTFGALIVVQTLAFSAAADRVRLLSDAAKRYGKIVCCVWLSGWLDGPGAMETEIDRHVALFRSMDRCFAALAQWHARACWLSEQPRQFVRIVDQRQSARVTSALGSGGHASVTESRAKQLLAAYGVPVADGRLVRSAEAAGNAAGELGYPVALKLDSPDIPHKTDAGVVRLDLGSDSSVVAAYHEIVAKAKHVSPSAQINGVLVQPMVPAGIEVIVGGKVDQLLGPTIVVGLGGIWVEVMKDSVLEMAPVNHGEALAMLGRLRGSPLLSGFRGSIPVDRDKLATIICRLSEFMSDQRDFMTELDVNPIICNGERIVAVDALITKQK